MNNLADFWLWLEDQRRAAIAAGVLERRFWNLTPADVRDYVAIARAREEREWERAAWMVHYILAGLVGNKAPSIARLLGRETDA